MFSSRYSVWFIHPVTKTPIFLHTPQFCLLFSKCCCFKWRVSSCQFQRTWRSSSCGYIFASLQIHTIYALNTPTHKHWVLEKWDHPIKILHNEKWWHFHWHGAASSPSTIRSQSSLLCLPSLHLYDPKYSRSIKYSNRTVFKPLYNITTG